MLHEKSLTRHIRAEAPLADSITGKQEYDMAHRNLEQLRIAVIGAGSWGTALASVLADKGYPVTIWAHEPEVTEEIRLYKENRTYLPGIFLPQSLVATSNIEEAVFRKDLLLFVVPSHVMRETARKVAPFVDSGCILVSASKGIENDTYKTMTGVLQEEITHVAEGRFAALSGPSFAREVGEKRPTVVTVAARDEAIARRVQEVFATNLFRVYYVEDVIGVEVGGAMKNVIAIAAGIADGMELGLNARAALVTRGLAEIRRLGVALGANPHTFSGLSGMGDLILTCTGALSRNHTLGMLLAEGRKLPDILKEQRTVAEGVKTTSSVCNLAAKLGVELPICTEVYHLLYDDASPREAVVRLMSRSLKQEFDSFM